MGGETDLTTKGTKVHEGKPFQVVLEMWCGDVKLTTQRDDSDRPSE